MEDTICAVSTIIGESALNVIKISGKKSLSIVNKIFNKDLNKFDSHTIHYGFIMDESEKIDEVLVSIFKAPKTYTKEDIIEINCHGGVASTNKILELLLINGCRLAEPGEFLKRAFLNGRINLVEAEAVGDIVSAKTEVARKIGMKALTGEATKLINNLRDELLSLTANIEVNIDYPEYEDALVVTNELLKEKTKIIKEKLEEIITKSENQQLLKNGITVSIVGKPNVGKSSLLNKLINEDKAIVTDIEGTTRDIVEGSIVLNGIEIKLIDTAGIRETSNIVEELGVKKSYQAIANSDLVLFVLDGSSEFTSEDKKVLESIKKTKLLIVINKSDKDKKIDEKLFKEYRKIYTSTKEESGTESLKNEIIKMFNLNEIELNDYTYLSNSRQISILKECKNIINNIEKDVSNKVEVDLIEIDIRKVWDKLGEITGDTYKENLIDEIFKNFCLGK